MNYLTQITRNGTETWGAAQVSCGGVHKATWSSDLEKTLDKLYHTNLIFSPWFSFIYPPRFDTRFKMQLRKMIIH